MAKSARKKKKVVRTTVTTRKKQSNKLGIFTIVTIVIIFIVAIQIQNKKLGDKLEGLKEEDQYYAELIQEENDRTVELEEKAKYVKTKAYIEEAAKKLGLVYPDEIIFKPKE